MSDFRVLVTGSRDWSDRDAVFEALDRVYIFLAGKKRVVVIHGAARGADSLAQQWFVDRLEQGWHVTEDAYPADWIKFGKSAGPIRNLDMVASGADICLAFPEGKSIGTRHCMKAAQAAGIQVMEFNRDGFLARPVET